jgi:hypothetical protein
MSTIQDRQTFIRCITQRLFGGTMTAEQQSGVIRILDEWDLRKLVNPKWLAYMLSTGKWETNATMQPVREAYWLTEDWRRRNLSYYPFYGRGDVQLTHERNYRVMTNLLRERFKDVVPDFDLVRHPDQAMIPVVSTAIMFEGMLRGESNIGDFTGKSLEDYTRGDTFDFINARRIINGTDKAAEIADIALKFLACIEGRETKPEETLLRYGSKGEAVKRLQQALGIEADGDFGPATEKAVRMFQADQGLLPPDGVVGPQTWAALKKEAR